MAYGIFLGIIGGILILSSMLVMFITLCEHRFSMKNGMPYVLGIGCLLLGVSNIIINQPNVQIKMFYQDCIWSNAGNTFSGGTMEDVCIKAASNYKKVMKYD